MLRSIIEFLCRHCIGINYEMLLHFRFWKAFAPLQVDVLEGGKQKGKKRCSAEPMLCHLLQLFSLFLQLHA